MTDNQATLEMIAPTVEEAVARGLADLGLAADAVDVEVLDSGSRGLLGLGGRQARVRLTIKDPAHVGLDANHANQDGSGSVDVPREVHLAEETTRELLARMGLEASIAARLGDPDDEGNCPVLVDVRGSDMGILVTRRAEILNALQHIVNLIVGKQMERWTQVVVDVEGYRARHERQLRQMAVRMADQAVKTGRRQVLEPMSPAERRIIHMELREHPGVTTTSIGEDPGRKVTIVPK
ncbi:MAG: protein jag [Chloroflexi bacterium]|nr:protein jag [Chloroflexota bacterium]